MIQNLIDPKITETIDLLQRKLKQLAEIQNVDALHSEFIESHPKENILDMNRPLIDVLTSIDVFMKWIYRQVGVSNPKCMFGNYQNHLQ